MAAIFMNMCFHPFHIFLATVFSLNCNKIFWCCSNGALKEKRTNNLFLWYRTPYFYGCASIGANVFHDKGIFNTQILQFWPFTNRQNQWKHSSPFSSLGSRSYQNVWIRYGHKFNFFVAWWTADFGKPISADKHLTDFFGKAVNQSLISATVSVFSLFFCVPCY